MITLAPEPARRRRKAQHSHRTHLGRHALRLLRTYRITAAWLLLMGGTLAGARAADLGWVAGR